MGTLQRDGRQASKLGKRGVGTQEERTTNHISGKLFQKLETTTIIPKFSFLFMDKQQIY